MFLFDQDNLLLMVYHNCCYNHNNNGKQCKLQKKVNETSRFNLYG